MRTGIKSLFGPYLGIENGSNSIVAQKGLITGAPGSQFRLTDPSRVVHFSDFVGLVGSVPADWAFTEGTDNTTSDGKITAAVNGEFVLTPGDSAGTIAADGAMLNSALQWKANQGELAFQAKVKLAVITSCSCFLGFTDTLSLEQPIQSASSADTITTTATDAVGFMFDTNMTTDNWWAVGVANDVDATLQNIGYAPVADTYETFRIEITTAGAALFFRNGILVSTLMAGAVTPTIALTPVFIVRPLSAAAGRLMTIDYAHISALRA
jgi:hypothetical protein